jgi:hypothetical protein
MQLAAASVYVLCFLTSAGCAGLLIRSYIRTRTRMLLLSAACFVFLMINNLLVVVDLYVILTFDFVPYRNLAALAAVSTLIIGFIWDTE